MNTSQSDKDHYELLKVSRDAPPEIIKAVYRAWMFALKLHPDLGGDGHAAKELNAAYEVLSDERARAEYDRTLSSIAAKDAEHRRAPRFFVDAEVACLFDEESSWTTARVLDASVMGLRLLQCVWVAKGTRALISFPCAAADAVESKVAWARLKKDSCEFGVEFYEPLHDVLQRLGCKKK